MTRIDYLAPELLPVDDHASEHSEKPHKDHLLRKAGYSFWEVLILSAILTFVALTLFAQTPTPGPVYPGYWHCGNGPYLEQCPCYPPPYTPWVDPATGYTYLYRYDFSPMRQPQACPGIPGQPAPCVAATAGGPNHSLTWLDSTYVERPIQRQPSTKNYYPGPPNGLCTVWLANNNDGVCPDPNYNYKMKSNPTWVAGYNYSKPFMDADPGCHSSAPTPTRTKTPTPTVTPTPAPNIYAAYITWAANNGITAGCGGGNFCPDNPVTRAQMTTFLWNLYHMEHPGSVLPPCQQQFGDVKCGP